MPATQNPDIFDLPFPVLLCDRDGSLRSANDPGRLLAGNALGKHAARLSPELGEALNRFRLHGRTGDTPPIRIGGATHGLEILERPPDRLFLILTPHAFDTHRERELELLKAALANTSEGVWIVTRDGIIQAINQSSERLNGIRARQVVGRSIKDALAEGLMDRSASMEVFRRKRQTSFVQRVSPSDKHLHVTGTPHYDAEGEIDFVVVVEKDVTDLKHMRSSVEESRKARDKARELLTELTLSEGEDPELVAASRGMRTALNSALKLARLDARGVMLSGEPGSGKHVVARHTHRHGPRRHGPFININCAALPPGLQEAELFGYERGAVKGIPGKGKAGILTLAEGGTLLMDDVGALGPQTQAKLLRCLDDGEYTPLGSRTPKTLDCMVMVAVGSELERLAARGLFREDLYHRLNMFRLRIPPLRERPEDIQGLAQLFLGRANATLGTDLRLTGRVAAILQHQEYPGNAHELEGLVMRAAALSEGDGLEAALEEILATGTDEPGRSSDDATLGERLAAVERDILDKTRQTSSTTREMAGKLGISQPSVVRKLRLHGLPGPGSHWQTFLLF